MWNLPLGDPLSPPSTTWGAGNLHSVKVQKWRFWACEECHSQWEIRKVLCGRTPLASLKRSEPYAFNSNKRCMRLPLMRGPGYQIPGDWSKCLQSWSVAWVWHMARIFWQTSVFSVGFFLLSHPLLFIVKTLFELPYTFISLYRTAEVPERSNSLFFEAKTVRLRFLCFFQHLPHYVN